MWTRRGYKHGWRALGRRLKLGKARHLCPYLVPDYPSALSVDRRGGGRVSLDGVAARGLVNGRGPRRSRGRDEVGTCSDGTKPNLPYRHCRYIHINTKEGD